MITKEEIVEKILKVKPSLTIDGKYIKDNYQEYTLEELIKYLVM